MNTTPKKNLKILALLLACLLLFTACRPSTALTRLMNVTNALNLGAEEMLTEEEQEKEDPSDDEPEREDEDNNLGEEEILTGQQQELDEAVEQALESIYSVLAETNEWGAAEVSTENIQISPVSTDVSDDVFVDNENQGSGQPGTEATEEEYLDEEEPAAEPSPDLSVKPGEAPITPEDPNGGDSEDPENPDGGDNDDDKPKDVVDPNQGELVELTETTGKVAATGQLAILVSMLGGSDRLCATSADYDGNTLAQKAFSGGEYEVLWSGDGSSSMSDESFQKLLAMKPGLCVEVSGYTTFTSSQIEQLEAAGTTYAALPGFSSAEDIETTVSLLATLLGDTSADGGTNAPEIAQAYLTWCADIESELSQAKLSGRNTVFIEDWDYNVQTVMYDKVSEAYTTIDTGAAVIRVGSLFRPLSDYLSYASVTDWAANPWYRKYKSFSNGTYETKYVYFSTEYRSSADVYAWDKWVANWLLLHPENCFPIQTFSGDLCYMTPIGTYHSNWYIEYGYNFANSSGTMPTYNFTNMANGISMILSYNYNGIGTVTNLSFGSPGFPDYIGGDGFPCVIVKDQDTGAALQSSLSWQSNTTTEFWESVTGEHSGSSTLTLPSGQTVPSTIQSGSYGVYVNPAGLGDWVEGSAESILESAWIAWRVQGYYSESKVKALIKEFYQKFYGYALSNSEIAEILAGPES